MILLIEEAYRFQQFVLKKGWDFYFVGGLAVQVWGEPRLTRDIDLHIFTNFVDEEGLVSEITARFSPKFSDAEQIALKERILPVTSPNGVTIDINLTGFADLSESLKRASYQNFTDNISLKICSADDLVILKTLAGRSRDWPDVESVLIKQSNLDWTYIEESIKQLFELESDLVGKYDHLLSLKKTYYRK